jgi:nicotinic acid phosphoribosyltransferase
VALTDDEEEFLAQKCSYLPHEYVAYLKQFRFRPNEQVTLTFTPVHEFTKQAEEEEGAPDHTEFVSSTPTIVLRYALRSEF